MAVNGSAPEAGQALSLAYQQVIGRTPTAAELALGVQQLQDGTPLSALRAFLATTGYAAAAIGTLYTDVLGRPVTAAELAGDERNLARGGSLAGLRSTLSTTAEAAGAVTRLFETTVGRIPTAYAEVPRTQAALAAGASLSSLRNVLATSAEERNVIALAYQHVLGRASTVAELLATEQALVAGKTTIEAAEAALTRGAEFAAHVNAAFEAALGRPANAVELAADRSEILGLAQTQSLERPAALSIDSGSFSFKDLQTQLGQLQGGAPAVFGNTIQISPQTIAGSSGLVYGLLNNDALITAHPVSVRDEYGTAAGNPFGDDVINGFNPATDIIQLQGRQAASFEALAIQSRPAFFSPPTVDSTGTNNPGGTAITFAGGATIELTGVTGAPGNALTAANFRFV